MEFNSGISTNLTTSIGCVKSYYFVHSSKIREYKFICGLFWIGSIIFVVGCQEAGNAEDVEWERKLAASKVPSGDLAKIELFDGIMRRGHKTYFGFEQSNDETSPMGLIEGRVRNHLSWPISSIEIRVVIRNSNDEIIESFDFGHSWLGTNLRGEFVTPGLAKGFSHRMHVERIPKDFKWDWRIVGATYKID